MKKNKAVDLPMLKPSADRIPSIADGLKMAAKVAEFIVAAFLVTRVLEHTTSIARPLRSASAWFIASLLCYWIPPTDYKGLGLKRWLLISFVVSLFSYLFWKLLDQ